MSMPPSYEAHGRNRISYARAFLDPNTMIGGDGDFSAPELSDWRDVVVEALSRVARSSASIELLRDGPLPAIAVSPAAWSARRTRNSGLVFFPRTRAICALRAGST